MTKPWLSVISPIYNGEKYLSQALDSVVIQEDSDIECIVVNGASTDATMTILHSYQKKLPITIHQKKLEDNWVVKTNYALSIATGEYVCFLHHDDFWLADRLKIMKKLVKQFPDITLFLHPTYFIDPQGNNVGQWKCPLPSQPKIIDSNFLLERLLVQNFISILGPIVKRETALKVGGLEESLWYTADWDFWLKIASCGDTVYYPAPLSGFRIHPSSQTIVRSSHTQDFHDQLESVAHKHLTRWEAPAHIKEEVSKIASFSNKVNSSLAGTLHGENIDLGELLLSFLKLGPLGWHRYLRDSRIWERTIARLRARVTAKP